MSLMMKAFINMSSTSNDVLPNPILADKPMSVIKHKFKDGDVTLSLKDPCANLRMKSNGVAFVTSWVRIGNQHVTFDPNDMRPTANLARSQVLAAGFREYGDYKKRVCLALALVGIMAMGYSNIGKPSPPPLILDLVPTHIQIEFDKKSGCARINASNTDVAELILVHVLATCNFVWIKGWDGINLTKKVIRKLGLVSMFLSEEVIIRKLGLVSMSMFLSEEVISDLIDDYHSPQARYNMEDSLPIILLFSRETKKPPSF
jgi:hypothetical protein